ncbi:MAG: MBL fold metallo-hydrolase [Eubacteriales bacterium]|nr:MBL fold metallo-hydrolase [Eubacteriales bacterium]
MLGIARLVVGPVCTNCFIVYDEEASSCIIVDPGDEAEKIAEKLGELGVTPKAVLLTHGHFDHILGIPGLREIYSELPVYAYEAEEVLLSDARVNESTMVRRPVTIGDVTYIENGCELEFLGVKWKVISTPGHTIGSCCYYIEEAGILFSGDTLFDGDCGRTDLATGDFKAIVHSIKDILMKLPDDTQVLPGHETFTTIGRERVYNVIMRQYGD